MSMPWTTAKVELRELLNDNNNDKLRFRKRVIGTCNGSNVIFKTLEFRRLTNFITPTAPFGVFISDAATAATVTADFPEIGSFQLATAPANGDFVEATYYVQFFLDAELDTYLTSACRWIQSSDDFTKIPPGLQPAALKYGAADAYEKLASKFQEHLSDTYRTEDAPDEKKTSLVSEYRTLALKYREESAKLRAQFYTRQDQALQPLFANNLGAVPDVPPRR